MLYSFAIMFFNEDHLRITKIKTVNGITPQTGEDERPVKKVIFAPLNKDTRKLFDDQNKRLPNNIKMKIEVVKAYHPEPVISKTETDNSIIEQKNKELEEQKEQNRLLQEQIKALQAQKVADPTPIGNTVKDQGSKSTVKNTQHETVQ